MRLVLAFITLNAVLVFVPSAGAQGEVDTEKALKVDTYCKENPDKVRLLDEDTLERCRGGQSFVIHGRDGDISIKPGQTRYFCIPEDDSNADKAEWIRSGGWYWHCGGSEERSRMAGSKYIKAVRYDDGSVRFFKVAIDSI